MSHVVIGSIGDRLDIALFQWLLKNTDHSISILACIVDEEEAKHPEESRAVVSGIYLAQQYSDRVETVEKLNPFIDLEKFKEFEAYFRVAFEAVVDFQLERPATRAEVSGSWFFHSLMMFASKCETDQIYVQVTEEEIDPELVKVFNFIGECLKPNMEFHAPLLHYHQVEISSLVDDFLKAQPK